MTLPKNHYEKQRRERHKVVDSTFECANAEITCALNTLKRRVKEVINSPIRQKKKLETEALE